MKELLGTLDLWKAQDVRTGRAVLIRAFGAAPCPEGSVMLATADGRIAGSVSAGCVEGAAAEEIQRALSTGRSRVVRYGISDERAADVGLACGSVIDILVEPEVGPAIEAAARETGRGAGPGAIAAGRVVVTPLPDDAPGPWAGPHRAGEGEPPAPRLVVGQDGRLEGSLGDASADEELVRGALDSLSARVSRTAEIGGRQLFIEVFPAALRVVIVGATQIAIPLVSVARALGYLTVVVDARSAFATVERFPDADRIVVEWPQEAAELIGLGPSDAVVVLSHDDKLDEPAISAALARGCQYVGAIGSRKRVAARRERMLAAGARPEELDALHSPVGLDLGGRGAAEIALAIMSEIVATRLGGTGLPLRDEEARARTGSGDRAVAAAGIPDR
jgi:xanthine dehydrogenase accessory factor